MTLSKQCHLLQHAADHLASRLPMLRDVKVATVRNELHYQLFKGFYLLDGSRHCSYEASSPEATLLEHIKPLLLQFGRGVKEVLEKHGYIIELSADIMRHLTFWRTRQNISHRSSR